MIAQETMHKEVKKNLGKKSRLAGSIVFKQISSQVT